ncbi:MAG: phosphoribosyl-AMP cyclohydrolase [Pseudomonadota bacterium]
MIQHFTYSRVSRLRTGIITAVLASLTGLTVAGCSNLDTSNTTKAAMQSITKADVLAAQKAWGDGIVAIGDVYQAKGDYASRASQHIKDLYAYGQSEVLFKPTLAADVQFRETFGGALSYFVGGEIAEDKGFAIKPWSKVRFGEQQIITDADSAVAMGNYYFTPVGSTEETKVEFTFGYMRDADGNLRINVHHSALPYSG